MKVNNFLIFILTVLIISLSIGAISATNDFNDTMHDDSVLTNSIDDNFASSKNYQTTSDGSGDESLKTSINDDVVRDSSGNTIVVPFDRYNPNEVLLPKIQPAIDGANSGDTIIIEGSPVHCHLTINKTIHIIAEDGKSIDPCPHHTHEGLTQHGVFYILEGGSGSVIEGFNFINNDRAETPFAIYIKGASDVTIINCTIPDSDSYADKYTGIIIENSKNIKLSNSLINNTIYGITIINSSNIDITDCILSNNENQAITISGDSRNINIADNSIIGNGNYGLNLFTVNNINVINNLIRDNGLKNDDSGSGIYVNNNITRLIVKGNIFLNNAIHAIMYDYRTRNLNNEAGAENLTIVDDNYFEGHSSMILHHRIYVERDYGTLKYDAENDVFGAVGEGKYAEGKSYVYMQNALIYNDVPCGFTYYTSEIPWAMEAAGNDGKYNFSLKLKLETVKNGVYKLSIVDSDGNVATNFNNFNLTFFLNGYSTVEPKEIDIYKKVLVENGVAVADFRDIYSSFNESGNVITTVFPGLSDNVKNSLNVEMNVADSDIPIDPSTKIVASKLTTYPLSDGYLSVKLVNSKGNIIANQLITFKFNGKTYAAKTNAQGIAKVKVSLSTKKTYSVTLSYAGNADYKSCKATSSIVVKTGSKSSKIKASNIKVIKNKKKTYQFKLTNAAGKALKSQKVTVKLNGKTYPLKTNSKGIAKLSVKLNKVKKYKATIKFLGNANYKAVSKTTTITVAKK